MDNPVIIIGAGGMGKAVLEIFNSNNVTVYGFLDDNKELQGTEIDEISVLGSIDNEDLLKLIGTSCEAFIATDDNKYRDRLVEILFKARNVMSVNAIHFNAVISRSAVIGHGNFINAGSKIGPGAKLGNHCIINTNVVIEYDANLDDFVQVGAGSIINSSVIVGKGAFIGSGVTIISGVEVEPGARIGAGSVVVSKVSGKETVFGNPAKGIDSPEL